MRQFQKTTVGRVPPLAGLACGYITRKEGRIFPEYRNLKVAATISEFRASKVIGMEVKDQQGENLAKIKGLSADSQNSWRISFAVLDPARSLEFGRERLVAIPFTAFSRNDIEHIYALNRTRNKLMKAPSFDEDHWPDLADRSRSADVYRYYTHTPYRAEGK